MSSFEIKWVQVGWLGASGKFYPLDVHHSEIIATETVSYVPVYTVSSRHKTQ